MPETVIKRVPVRIKDNPAFTLAWWQVDSGRKGPCLLVTAALHGNEVQGSEVLRRFRPVAEKNLVKGRMLLVPFANPLALWNRRHNATSAPCRPKDAGGSVSSAWPGSPDGSEAEQTAHVLSREAVGQATHCIDLHCWSRFNATAALAPGGGEVLAFVKASALPFIKAAPSLGKKKAGDTVFTLASWFNNTGRMAFGIELSGQYAVSEEVVRTGVRALCNCSKYLGMFDGPPEGIDRPAVYYDDKAVEEKVLAPAAGLFIENGLAPGDFVSEGGLLGTLFSDSTLKSRRIKAPVEGYLFSYGRHGRMCDVDLADMHPYAGKGDVLAVIVNPRTKI